MVGVWSVGTQCSFSQFWTDTNVATGQRECGGSARISECGRYRYVLGRRWGDDVARGTPAGPGATFIMLNPSTADAHVDDPTIRRCIGFAKRIGCASMTVVNLFALRSTDPKALSRETDNVGPENDMAIRTACHPLQAKVVIAAWGIIGQACRQRVSEVLTIVAQPLFCLGKSAGGAPRHPLYLPSSAELVPWPWTAS